MLLYSAFTMNNTKQERGNRTESVHIPNRITLTVSQNNVMTSL